MRLLKQNNGHSCLLYSAAMVLDLDPDWIIERIGHDGSLSVNGEKPKGFHIQEIIEVVLSIGKTCTPVQIFPTSRVPGVPNDVDINFKGGNVGRIMRHLCVNKGILEGQGARYAHACAWNGSVIFDPKGKCYPLHEAGAHNFQPSCFWLIL